ncbi:MAG: hypothetical protein M1833_004767 [Piccolia ochrophora]|nr:MAG: hypothetical protein M1833_004767 [Piccolia ochrophora]
MGLQFLREYADEVYARWLASAWTCCSPYVRHQEDADIQGIVETKTIEVYNQQPHRVSPPRPEPQHQRAGSRSTEHSSRWMDRSRSIISNVSSRGSVYGRRRTISTASRRPTIGAPSDFRRVDNYQSRRREEFRPLELSIYLPHNRLSPLPTFDPPGEDPAELEYPAQARTVPRTTSILSNTSDFRIRRKPIGSSVDLRWTDVGRRSIDTRSTPSINGSEWVSHPLRPRPSLPESLSTQELISALETRLPKPPVALRTRSSSDSVSLLQRRDSDQFRRAYSGVEDHNDADTSSRAIDTIVEERQSPIADRYHQAAERTPISPSATISRPSTPTVAALNMARSISSRPTSSQSLTNAPTRDRSLSRVSKWLFPSSAASPITSSPIPTSTPQSFYQCTAATVRPTRSSTISTVSSLPTLDESTITPQSSPGGRATPIRHRTFGHADARERNSSSGAGKKTAAEVQTVEVPSYQGSPAVDEAAGLWGQGGAVVVGMAF